MPDLCETRRNIIARCLVAESAHGIYATGTWPRHCTPFRLTSTGATDAAELWSGPIIRISGMREPPAWDVAENTISANLCASGIPAARFRSDSQLTQERLPRRMTGETIRW